MQSDESTGEARAAPAALREAVAAYAAFCALSLLSRLMQPLFLVVVLGGLGFPLIWARRQGDGAANGLTRRGLGRALLWGLSTGTVGLLYVVWAAGRDALPPPELLGLQLAVGTPLALLILSPFQELFFRGWLQPRLERALGLTAGLVITALAFTVWHLLPPFEGSPSSSVRTASAQGLLTTLGMGLAFGYIFQRTRNIAAPWLAHAMMIIGLLVVGAMTIVQYTP